MQRRISTSAIFVCALITPLLLMAELRAELHEQSGAQPPALEQTHPDRATAASYIGPRLPTLGTPRQEKPSRIWSNEPELVRLARAKFGAELTETDAKFFAAIAENELADMRPTEDAKVDPDKPSSWAVFPTLAADRISWLCTDAAVSKLIPKRGLWLRGAKITGRLDLYRSEINFPLAFYDCMFVAGFNISHAKLQELDIRNSCSAAVSARAVHVAENVYLLNCSVFGGLDLIDSNIGGDFDFSGGHAYQGMSPDDVEEQGVAINFHDAKVAGGIKLGDGFRAVGQVRLIGVTIGNSLTCSDGKFNGCRQAAIDARHTTIAGNMVCTNGFVADGGLQLRRAKIGGDLECNGGRFIGATGEAFCADLAEIGGQVLLGDGFHAEGEIRIINASVAGDIDCDNGHFLHPEGDALTLDGTTIGRSLRIGADPAAATDTAKDLPTGFLTRGTFRLWSTQVNQDILANGARFESPKGTAVLACNVKVASRVVLTYVTALGTVNLFSADIEHELDLRASTFDGSETFGKIALWATSAKIRGHVYCNQFDTPDGPAKFKVKGLTSFQFAKIDMHWDLYGAELVNPGGDALDASDCRLGGYVNIDSAQIDGRASFSRAKIDGMFILNKSVEPEKTQLDLRFAHIWVIKDERLDDWPPAGHLQLEGLVYDHFDDDSPLDVQDRLAWLRRQYGPVHTPVKAATAALSGPRRLVVADGHEKRKSVIGEEESGDRYNIARVSYESSDAATDVVAPGMAAPQMQTSEPAMPSPLPPIAEANGDGSNASDAVDAKQAEATAAAGKAAGASATVATAADPVGRRYITQPYTQLAAVYRAIGQDEQASTVLVARAERLGELAPRLSAQGLWYRYLGRLIGYGYEPFRAIKIGLVIIGIGALVFAIGNRRNLMAETKLAEQVLDNGGQLGLVSPTYPRFNAIVYSLDVFLPFVDLNQVCYWIPGEKPSKPRKSRNCLMHIGKYSLKWSAVLHCYLWFQTLAGWTLCTLLAAAVTGIVQS